MEAPLRLRVEGSPRAMGEAQGEALRDAVRAFVDLRFAVLERWLRDRGRPFDRAAAVALAEVSAAHVRGFDPEAWTEFEACARAAGLPAADLLAAASYTDLRDALAGARAGAPDDAGCSTLLVAPARSSTEAPLLAQTWDMHASAAPFVLLLERRPEEGAATLSLSTPGCPPVLGLSAAVGAGNSNVIGRRGRPGVPYLFLVGRAIRSASTEEAVGAIVGAERMGCHCYLLADAAGDVRHLEAALEWAAERRVEGIHVATNHFQAPGLVEYEADEARAGTSCPRLERLEALAAEAPGRLSPADLRAWLDDGEGGEGAIRRPAEGHAVGTCAAAVIDVGGRRLAWRRAGRAWEEEGLGGEGARR